MVRNFSFKTYSHLQFEVKDFIEIYKKPHLFSGYNRADFFQFVWVRKGTIKLTVDFKELVLNEGNALFISNKQVFGYDNTSNAYGKIILFTEFFFNQHTHDLLHLNSFKLLNPNKLNSIVDMEQRYMEMVLNVFEIISNQNKNLFQEKIIHSHLYGLLLEAERVIDKEEINTDGNKCISQIFFNEVESCYKTHKKVTYYCLKLGVSNKVLNQEIKKVSLQRPKEYINNRLILEAKRLLAHTSMRVNEIGYELGFDEATNFNKFFLKYTKMTPIHFKMKHHFKNQDKKFENI